MISANELVTAVLDHPQGGVEQLVALTDGQEDDWLEFKAAIREQPDDDKPTRASLAWNVTHAIVAMMNTRGGAVILGYAEEPGKPAFPIGLAPSDPDGLLASDGRDAFMRKVVHPALLPVNGKWKTLKGTWHGDVERISNHLVLSVVNVSELQVVVCIVSPIAEGEPLLAVTCSKNKDVTRSVPVRERGLGRIRTLGTKEAEQDYLDARSVTGTDLNALAMRFRQDKLELSRLAPPCEPFLGRPNELERLDDAWRCRDVRIVCVVGSGGEGKTSLVARWLNQLSQRGFEGALRVFGWSFLNQGIDGKETSADDFFEAALEFFRSSTAEKSPTRDRGRLLAELIGVGPNLLVLDGVEPLLHTAGPNAGLLRDPSVRSFLTTLSHHGQGFCAITTRRVLGDVAGLTTTRELPLTGLQRSCGVALLEALGVHGPPEAMRATVDELDGHALSLNLLGTYLRDRHRGNINDRNRVQLTQASTAAADHAQRILDSYVQWFETSEDDVSRAALAVLRLLGLFNRPVRREWLEALRRQPIPDFTEGLFVNADTPESSRGRPRHIPISLVNSALTRLEQARLINDSSADAIDCHPLIRWYFREELQRRFPAAAKRAHALMFDHLRLHTIAEHRPSDDYSMDVLYHAVVHGARSGQLNITLTDVYKERIQRHDEFFAIGQLGMLGDDLAALDSFFEAPWELASPHLSVEDQAYVLNQAGILLWPIGQLEEAQAALNAGFELAVASEHWRYASVMAGNMAQLSLIRGNVAVAVMFAKRGVELAGLAGDDFSIVDSHRRLGAALHRKGEYDGAERAFRIADSTEDGKTLSHPGFYCSRWGSLDDLLLDQGRYAEAKERLTQRILAPVREVAFDVALNQLRLGRALMQEALRDDSDANWNTAQHYLVEGLQVLEQQRDPIWERVSEGYLYLAQLHRALQEPETAQRCLIEAESCAARYDGAHSIPACTILIHIERARLHSQAGEDAEAKRLLQQAQTCMAQTGFFCYAHELNQLSTQLESGERSC